VICTDCIGSYKSNYHTTKNNHDLNRDLNYLSTKVLITVIGVHTFTQQYPRIPLEYPKIPQNTNNIKILKDFGFFFFFYSVDGDISQKATLIELLFVLLNY
jgi:hypothetical protein